MIVRVFRVMVLEGKEARFRKFFTETALALR